MRIIPSGVREEVAEVRAIHLPGRWIHLSFDTPDRRVNVTLTDDGSTLSVSAASSACSSSLHPLRYEGTDEESDLYRAMVAALENVIESCGNRMVDAGRSLSLLKRTEPEFVDAMRVMKSRVLQAFGGRLNRCRLPDPGEERVLNHSCG